MKSLSTVELCTGQLSWSEKFLSPYRMNIKLGYLGSKNRSFETGEQNMSIFPLLWGKKDPREACSTPSLPGGLGRAAGSNQPEAPGIGAAAGAGSSGAAGRPDTFLQFDQTFSSAY